MERGILNMALSDGGMTRAGMIDRTGISGSTFNGGGRRESRIPHSNKKVKRVAMAFGVLAIAAVLFLPISNSLATPSKENGGCNSCHSTAANFITVTGLPASQYTPGGVYRVTVTVSDPDTASTNENSFDIILSSGGGTLTLGSPTDPNVEINSVLEASANDGVSPMGTHTWNFTWTAPTSGSVTVDVWGVVGGFGGSANTGTKAPYDHDTFTLSSNAIPEFPTFLIPVIGIVGAVIVMSRLTKRTK